MREAVLKQLNAGPNYRIIQFQVNLTDSAQDSLAIRKAADMNAIKFDPVTGSVSLESNSLSLDMMSNKQVVERYGHLYEIRDDSVD
ncbi:MAG: hypothetical protein KDN22_12055 [Verrucomicrobiae bacterium]|nr:hypothetical protein [Verrucomicrobiae bacterium]